MPAKLSDRYYSGREVQRILGITEPSLRNLVNQKKLRKVIPPGRQTGVYLKEDVDTFAEKWFAFLTDAEPPKTAFEIAQAEDMDAVYELSLRAIGQTMNAQVRREWLAKNPESCYVVKHGDKVVAFFHLLPIKHNRLMEFMDGKIRGWEITGDDVETFEPGRPTECLLIIASEPDVNETTRKHYVSILLRGIRRRLKELGERGIILTSFYATSQTPTGIAMAMHAGMENIDPQIGKRHKFVMHTETSKSFLLDGYKAAIKQYKQTN